MAYSPNHYYYTIVVTHLVYGNYFPIGYNGALCEAKRLAKELKGRLFTSISAIEINVND